MKVVVDKNRRKTSFHILYIFLGLFVLMMGYFTYFILIKSNEVVNNSYNKRQEILARRVVRGKILSGDRKVLAQTLLDEDGNETREYPYGEVFCHVVGRTSKGKSGIEQTQEIRLLTSNVNAFEMMYNDLSGVKSPGDNIITTLDANLSKIAYDALGNYQGAVVVMEPSTGKILAMVSKPSYDPNKVNALWDELIADEDAKSPLINRATQGLYPPGSTFKLLTSLEYIRENPDTYAKYKYDCDGGITYDSMTIHCHNNKVHGLVNLPLSFAKSCNTSYASIGKSLDLNRFYDLCEGFLFNKNLPIQMESNPSRFTMKKGISGVKEAMQTAIGQGNTLITPLHNAMITATVANGGVMMKPYLVDRIENANGSIIKRFSGQEIAKPITRAEAIYITKMMRKTVTEGTATKLKDLKQGAAGKTGSADNSAGKAHAWFIGYAPYEKPEIAVSIIVENVGTGSDFAVPIAKKIFDAYFK